MAHAPKDRLLPDNILERPDGEVAELVFGKAVKQELDRIIRPIDRPVDASEKSTKEA